MLEEVRLEYEDQLKKYEGNLKVSKSTIEELEARHSEDTDYIASLRDQVWGYLLRRRSRSLS